MTMNKALVAQIRDALESFPAMVINGEPFGNDKAKNALQCLTALEEAEQCNGWTNWETWNVKLWLDNEQGTYVDLRDAVRDSKMEDGSAAEAIKEFVEQLVFGDEAPANMATDLTRGALAEVNWQEIARALAEEMADENGEL